jgi:hypothetical protein
MRANEVPAFDSEDTIRRTVMCERCLQPALYRLDVASGHFVYECPCTQLEATEIMSAKIQIIDGLLNLKEAAAFLQARSAPYGNCATTIA